MDLVGPLHVSKQGYKYVVTLICLFTSFVEAISLQVAGAQEVWQALDMQVFSRFGPPGGGHM